MQTDLITKIKMLYNTFTRAEKQVSDVVLQNPAKVLYMSISELSELCGVGDTSVFRFCKHLGKKGYMDFKMDLAQSVSNREDNGLINNSKSSLEQIAQNAIELASSALKETLSINDLNRIENVSQLMINAERIFFVGAGSSMASAYEANCRFMRITPKAFTCFDAHLQSMRAALMKKNDLVIVFSYTGATKDIIATCKIAKEAGAKIVAITRFKNSALTKLSDITLLCGANENPTQGGSFSVKISQLFLIDILFNAFINLNREQCIENRKKTMSSISEKII